ncbi:Cation channel sperm-associated protein 4, partial [Geodia barretti]
MFIFSIIGLSLFGDSCPRHFGTLGKSMFSLFVCVTQDGWMGITEELQQCGYFEVGAVYLVIFITIGAFVFANLVVAVVVTNLEWAIAEQKGGDQKHQKSADSEKIRTVDAHQALMRLARQQTPLQVPQLSLDTRCLE